MNDWITLPNLFNPTKDKKEYDWARYILSHTKGTVLESQCQKAGRRWSISPVLAGILLSHHETRPRITDLVVSYRIASRDLATEIEEANSIKWFLYAASGLVVVLTLIIILILVK